MITCLVIDDEPIARKGILEHIEQIDFLSVVAECKNGVDAAVLLKTESIDLIFLDIQMPQLNGIDLLKSLPHPPLVIFTTAYPQYAIEGFELDVLDYLLKPISFPRFFKAALKAQEFLKKQAQFVFNANTDFFFVKVNQKLEKIKTADIKYIESMSNYVVIHTASRKYMVYLTFKGIEEKLPSDLFFRIHKSYIVNVQAIDAIDANEILIGTLKLPLGKFYRDEIIKKIESRLFKR